MNIKTTAVVLVCFCLFAAMAAGVAYLLQDLPPTHAAARATMAAAEESTPASGRARFGPITFGTAMRDGTLLDPGATFPGSTREVYATWACQDMVDGTPFHLQWYHNDAQHQEEALVWDDDIHGAAGGQAYIASLTGSESDSLPSGNYRLVLYIGERQVQEATFVILAPEP
jgi:hypothetical protein